MLGTALITGSSKRIGREMALDLADQGYNVAVHYYQSKDSAEILKKDICSKGVRCEIFCCDLSSPKESQSLIKSVRGEFKDLTLLVNNASIFEKDTIKDLDVSLLMRHLNIHVVAPLVLISDFAKFFKSGNIVNILDRDIVKNETEFTTYLIAKKVLKELTEVASVQLAPDVRVNAIAPGLILAPENEGLLYMEKKMKKVPLQKIGSPQHVCEALRFLIRNTYLTGQTIFVDGGERLSG